MNNIKNFRITNGSIVRTILWIGLAYALFYFRDLLLTLLVGLVVASTMDPVAKFFNKYKVPRVVTIAMIFILFFSAILLAALYVLPSLADDIVTLIGRLPILLNEINVFGKDIGFKELSAYVSDLSRDISKGQILDVVKNSIVGASSVAQTTGAIVGNVVNFVLMLVFAFYLAVQEDGINKFLRLITPKFYEKYILDLWDRSEKKIGSWAKGQIFVGVIMAVLVYICLKFIGMPYASLFALLTFFGEMIPMVGLLLSSVPAILVGYFTHDMSYAFMVVAIFFVLSQLENYIIYPKIMNKVIGVPAIIILVAFIIGAKLAGFWGVVLAAPIAAIVMEFVNDILNDKLPTKDGLDTIVYE